MPVEYTSLKILLIGYMKWYKNPESQVEKAIRKQTETSILYVNIKVDEVDVDIRLEINLLCNANHLQSIT